MDQNHVVPDQLPDEKYIERLFPKCPPKQQQQQQQGSYYGANDKRPAGLTRSSSARLGNAGLDGAGSSGVSGNSGQKRRAKYKVQQHSRRELEARRNKNKEAASLKDINQSNSNNNNNIIIGNANNNNGHSSDSSDDNSKISNNRGRSCLRRSNSSNSQQYGGGSYTNNSAVGSTHKIVNPINTSQTSSIAASSSHTSQTRRSGKYAASQSLLTKQLQRSQSSYNTVPSSSIGDQLVSNIESVALNNASVESSDIVKTTNSSQAVSRGASGIVKSASSFTFPNELQQPNNSAIRTPAAPSTKCQPQVSNLKMVSQKITKAYQDELTESGKGSSSQACTTHTSNQTSHLEMASNNDNSPSDLFDNTVDYNIDIAATTSSTVTDSRIRSHRGSNSLSVFENNNNSLRQQQASQNVERNAQELINDVPSVHRNERIKSIGNRTAKMFECSEDQVEPVLVDVAPASTPASAVSAQSSAIPQHQQRQQQIIQTAGLDFHEKIGDNRRDPLAATTTAGVTSIVGPSQQVVRNIDTDKSSCLNDLYGSKTTSNKPDSEINELPPNRSKDDDKYINLFVYDNATNHLLKNQQLEASPEGKREQLQQSQVSHSNKNTKNRPRGKRYSNKFSDLNRENDESNFESQRDNIETIEIVEEKESSLVAPTSTAIEFEEQLTSPLQQTTVLPLSAPVPANLGHIEFENNSSNSQAAPNIVSIHHQASQQLLATDFNDNDNGIVRHDASTEELCNTSDSLDETKKCINQWKNQESENLSLKRLDSDSTIATTTTNRTTSNTRSHRVSPTIGLLQTVDEKAEINSEELRAGEKEEAESVEESSDKTNLELNSDTMPANKPSFTKKTFVPPGHPQRIRPQVPSTESQSPIPGQPISLARDPLREISKVIGIPSERALNPATDLNPTQDFRSIIKNHTKTENQRVKFDEANLVSVRDGSQGRLGQVQQNTPEGDKMHVQEATSPIIKRANEHPPQMPSISEAEFESEIDVAKAIDFGASDGRDLAVGMKKISISSAPPENFGNFSHRNGLSLSEKHHQTSREKDFRNNSYCLETQQTQQTQHQQQLPDIQSYTSVDQTKSIGLETATRVSNLRHHKLPNETSHYSVVRAGGSNSGAACSNNNNGDHGLNVPSRSSSIQFNTLSDGESGAEDDSSGHSVSARSYPTQISKKCDQSQQQQIGQSNRNYMGTSASSKNSGSGGGLNDDDMMPTTKTALIFPRLDEGLSSEAESCEDDIDEDDERAMDADVDADDDDDNDNDIDDDLDNDNLSLDKSALQLNQSTVDCFLRQQQQQSKPQNRLIGSPPQQGSLPLGIMADQSELQQVKAPGSAYGGYMNQDPLDQNDLKSMSGYPNHNGQSNYWMGVSSHQQPNMSSQPSSSQHFSQTRNQQHNNNPMSKNNNSFNREEAKATNRLSSDTDNETDRLLGSQRNDQLKLTNNDVNSNNSTDLQPVSNVIKQNPNSREVLIEGVLFIVKYLGSTHSDCEGRSEKEDRIHQAEMAVHEVKFRNDDPQEVQLFISTEKIMVLDDKNRKIKMDHSLRTISYIADIGDAIVLIVRTKNSSNDMTNELGRPVSKISCHVFESSESHTITKSISQAFQVAYTELLKANGTGDTSGYLPKELDYQEVLNSQEMSTDELEMFARKENQREVIVPKEKGEILGLSIVESGWGSVLPTVVIANLKHDGPAYRCKKLSIGDQILSVNGISLVGLPMAECQEILRKTKKQSVARLSVVPCPITVEVKIKRPDTKYQLGFSVQNGVICSLLRGGIAERGGVRVGHRIMSINGTAVVGVPHEKIVTLLASSVGEIRMKTCLTSLYRLILGEEKAVHF